ncbi:DUF6168 family protein [Olleya sp. R77988]|uniref:DUF6168 family protein n=1 Tax=Olleya sp. R77988 TaxID=3093875 RepID=UPI0037C951D0
MIKKISVYLVSFSVLFAVSFFAHQAILKASDFQLRFSLLSIYIFHFIVSFIISAGFLMLSKSLKWSSQLGFVYIFAFITKFLFFAAAFKDTLLGIENLSRLESLNLLIPLFLFLFLEVYFIANILNKK